MGSRPSKADFPTWWSYRQANRAWLRAHGGHLWTTVLLAVVVGLISDSAVVLVVLLVGGLMLHGAVRRDAFEQPPS